MTTTSTDRDTALCDAYFSAKRAGDENSATAAAKKLPLHPSLAQYLKETIGMSAFSAEGYDLSRATELYGEDWLNG